jgi:hypothetical protein
MLAPMLAACRWADVGFGSHDRETGRMDEAYQLFELIRALSDRVLNLELQLSIVQIQLDDHRKAHREEPPVPDVPPGHDSGLD